MIVYRLQHKESGKGPYTHLSSINVHLDEVCGAMNARNCPEPSNDKVLTDNYRERYGFTYDLSSSILSAFVFGFSDTAQLKKWFGSPGIMKLLLYHGFEVVVKDVAVDSVVIGDSQCIIDIDEWANTESLESWIPERYRDRFDELMAAT